jgi:hypothetical protein
MSTMYVFRSSHYSSRGAFRENASSELKKNETFMKTTVDTIREGNLRESDASDSKPTKVK